jgi:hypothetical protein
MPMKGKKRLAKTNKKSIPDEVKKQVDETVKEFNQKILKDPNYYYVTRYKGSYLYLDRYDYGRFGPICRLRYTGSMNEWEFAIFKYSDERYDPEEWLFPGSGHIDGTIEGAMRAGLEAYP